MTAGLETFAKVRALHDSTSHPGEKASAAARMTVLARKAGMTVAEAVSKLDAKTAAPRNPFDELFNSPEARAAGAERERRNVERRAAALAEHGTEATVWAATEREVALEEACRPVMVRKPIIGGDMDTLMGWTGGRLRDMPQKVREVVSRAYPLPATTRDAWAELAAWEKLTDDRCAFFKDYSPDVRTRARTAILEHFLDTLPAHGMCDLRARLGWMQHVLDLGFSRDIREDQACLATLRADIERMGERLREQDAAPVHGGHPRRPTRAQRHAAIRALIAEGHADREIARRLGISPTTVGTIRRAGAEASTP